MKYLQINIIVIIRWIYKSNHKREMNVYFSNYKQLYVNNIS